MLKGLFTRYLVEYRTKFIYDGKEHYNPMVIFKTEEPAREMVEKNPIQLRYRKIGLLKSIMLHNTLLDTLVKSIEEEKLKNS